jgi:CBS domain-containing protein
LKKFLGTKVEDVMTAEIKTVKEDAPVGEAANIMIKYNINRVPVLDSKDELVGIVTRADIVGSMI